MFGFWYILKFSHFIQMSQSKKQFDDFLVEAYVQHNICSQYRSFYPDDIRHLILSYFHRSSYFEEGGHLCTINHTSNILLCEYSWYRQTAKRCLINFIKFMIKVSIMIILYRAAFTLIIIFLFPCNYCIDDLGCYLAAWFSLISLTVPYYRVWKMQTNIGQIWLSTSNCCYISNIMPSHPSINPDNSRVNGSKQEWEYKLKMIEITDNVSVFIGLIDERDIDYKNLNGPPLGYDDFFMENTIDTKYGNYGIFIDDFITVGEVLTFIYKPNHPTEQFTIILDDSESAWGGWKLIEAKK